MEAGGGGMGGLNYRYIPLILPEIKKGFSLGVYMKCSVCGEEFEGRSDALYCSSTCRSRRSRLSVAGSVATDKSATDNATDNFVDIVKDLKLDPEKDLGIYYWTENGVFIRPDITVDQVQNIARLIHAKHGRECVFNEARL